MLPLSYLLMKGRPSGGGFRRDDWEYDNGTPWGYRKSLELIGSTEGVKTDYQMMIRAFYNYSFPDGRFYSMSDPWVAIAGDPTDTHYLFPAHKTNIVEVNQVVDGLSRKYLAYDTDVDTLGVRLYYADVLDGAWTAYSGNPVIAPNARNCSVVYDAGVYTMIVAIYDPGAPSGGNNRLSRYTSNDGITFNFVEFLTVNLNTRFMNPFLWYNPNDSQWYLWYNEYNAVDANCRFYMKTAGTIAGLTAAGWAELVGVPRWRSVASVMYRNGQYWLSCEDEIGGVWVTFAFYGAAINNWTECDDSPILQNEQPCSRMGLSPDGSTAYLWYSLWDDPDWLQRGVELGLNSLRPNEVDLDAHSRTDFGDVRFTKADGATLLDYFMESKTDNDTAVFWVEVDTIPVSPNTVTIYIYYGLATETTTSNGENTFPLLFDDFLGIAIDPIPWNSHTNAGGTIVVAASIASFTVIGNNSSRAEIWTKAGQLYDQDYAVRYKAQYPALSLRHYAMGGWTNRDDADYPMMNASETGLILTFGDSDEYMRSTHLDVSESNVFGITLLAYEIFEVRRNGAASVDGIQEGIALLEMENSVRVPTGIISVCVGCESNPAGGLGANITLDVDWLLVRQFASPEPTYGDWGAEETP